MIKLFIIVIVLFTIINCFEKMDNIYFLDMNETKCCTVDNKFNENGFYYDYTKTDCKNKDDVKNFSNQINSSRLLTNDKYPYNLCELAESNKLLDSNPIKLGSCRRGDRECFDFVNKQTCDKYGMRWEPVTCNTPIKYINEIPNYTITTDSF